MYLKEELGVIPIENWLSRFVSRHATGLARVFVDVALCSHVGLSVRLLPAGYLFSSDSLQMGQLLGPSL